MNKKPKSIPAKVVRVKNGKLQYHVYTEKEKIYILEQLSQGKDRHEINEELNFEWQDVKKD